jgi:hypothetical protein
MRSKIRKPTDLEIKLIEVLIDKSSLKFSDWKEKLMVQPMSDGGMGSLTLFPNGTDEKDRKFGKSISEHEFYDSDSVMVSVALYVDTNDQLYELDMWKVDFSPLMEIDI